jgi:hypothetical protein
VRVRGGDHVGPRRVDLRVDRERGAVHRPVALDHLAALVDEQQILHGDVLEVHAQRIDPEVIESLRVARGDVTRNAFVESELSEQSERGGEALLAVAPFVLDVVELRELRRDSMRHHGEILRHLSRHGAA